MSLPPWAEGPFELIYHAELHYRVGEDFDRRIALISFDNAIEVAITTYLSLHPIQRQNKTYDKKDVEKWLENYHTKLEFFEDECGRRELAISIQRSYIVWYHRARNQQYHAGTPSAPNRRELDGVREAALWVFSVLYDVPNVEHVLDERITTTIPIEEKPKRDPRLDRLLDDAFGMTTLAGDKFYTSEVLHSFDVDAYREIAIALSDAAAAKIEDEGTW